MKSLWKIGVLLLFIFITVGCTKDEDNRAKDIFEKAVEASQSIQSFELESKLNQKVTIPEMSDPLDQLSLVTYAKIQMDPVAIYQETDFGGSKTRAYFTEDGLFVQQPETKTWIKAASEGMNEELLNSQQAPDKQLEQLEKFAEDFKVEEKEDVYEISLSSSDETMKKFIQELLEQQQIMNNEDMLKTIKIKVVDIQLHINKENYYPKNINMSMELENEQNGKLATVNIDFEGSYSNFNSVEQITVPEDVRKNAEELTPNE